MVNVTKISAELKWAIPDTDGGSPVTNYVVEKRDVRRKAWQTVDTTVKDLKYTVTPLTEGSLYVFRVAAENAAGQSEFNELEDSILAKDTFSKVFFCVPGYCDISMNGTVAQCSTLQLHLGHHML